MHSFIVRARARLLWFGAGLGAVTFAACSKDVTSADVTSAQTIVVAPATATVPVGASVTLNADVLDANGDVIPSVRISWASEDTSIADVTQLGIVTGRRTGTVLIAASWRGRDAVATITVTPAPVSQVARVVVSPSNPRISEGQTIQLVATAYDANNRVISGLTVIWRSSNTSRATVDSTGTVHGLTDGNVTITATVGGKSGSTTVRIDG